MTKTATVRIKAYSHYGPEIYMCAQSGDTSLFGFNTLNSHHRKIDCRNNLSPVSR